MKANYETYAVDSKVYAINRMHDKNGKPTNFLTIYEAIVSTAYISKEEKTNSIEVQYWLKTPKGEDWGDTVDAIDVSDDFDELVKRIKPIWLSESNTFGDPE